MLLQSALSEVGGQQRKNNRGAKSVQILIVPTFTTKLVIHHTGGQAWAQQTVAKATLSQRPTLRTPPLQESSASASALPRTPLLAQLFHRREGSHQSCWAALAPNSTLHDVLHFTSPVFLLRPADAPAQDTTPKPSIRLRAVGCRHPEQALSIEHARTVHTQQETKHEP